ncbi:MAG: exonuclease SbcCD subunit D [Dehalococcoidia bacterium]|jgi:exonuclease SbcD
MKIIHFADAHIGLETYGGMDSATGLNTRVIDELKALDAVIDFAISDKADLVLFCGDAYKNREPSPTYQREFARRIRRLSEAKIHTVAVVGNHDLAGSPGKASSVEIFDTLDIEYIHVANKPGILNIATGKGEIQVAVFPWPRRTALLAREDVKNLGIGQVIEQLQDAMADKLVELAGNIEPSKPAVLAAHVAVSSAKTGTEKNMVIGSDPVVMLSTIASPVYDYIALGHVHRQQVLSETPPVVYAGSLERLDFGDEGEDKGFYVVEIKQSGKKRRVNYEFHKMQARRFLTLEIEVPDEEADPTGRVLSEIANKSDDIGGAIVRLKLSLPGHLASTLRDAEIFKALKEAYNVSIARDIRKVSRSRGAGWINDTLTPLEALRKYMETQNIAVERRKKLLEYGEKLINEKLSADRGTHAG